MAATDVPSVNIVHKVLNQDNYELWSFRVKTYLIAKDLWSVVTNEAPKNEDNIWSKKNAEALHAIHICCGDDMFPIVKGLDSAKAAWDKLKAKLEPKFKYQFTDDTRGESVLSMTVRDLRRHFPHKPVMESDVEEIRHLSRQWGSIGNAIFIYAVTCGYLDVIKDYLAVSPQVLKIRHSYTGVTALHCAVLAGHELVVKELVDFMSKGDLEAQSTQGMTALALAASVGNIQMAKYVVEKNSKSVTIKSLPNTLPLTVACNCEKWDMAQYLYSLTPLEALTQEDNGREGAQLISSSFYSKEFDIALNLISRCPTLTFVNDYSGNPPLYILATMCSAFLTGTRLAPWQKWIYHRIEIQPAAVMVSKNIENGQGNQRKVIIYSGMQLKEVIEDGESNQRNFKLNSAHALIPQNIGNHNSTLQQTSSNFSGGFYLSNGPSSSNHSQQSTGNSSGPPDSQETGIGDSGATHHMTSDLRNLTHAQPFDSDAKITIVTGCFRGLSKNLLHLLGNNHIREKKLFHVRTLEMLHFMCKATTNLTPKQMQEGIVLQAMLQAVEQGNVGFIRKLCVANPVITLVISDDKEKSLLQFSIECRQEKVYRLLLGLIPDNDRKWIASGKDKFGNSLLHSAGLLSATAIAQLSHIQGAALQLQRELQWFEEVESIVLPKIHDMVNDQGMRARELFTKNHKEMVNDGEKQMKEIASSCTVVGALIVTTMFAAAFDVPQGTNGDKKIVTTFIISDSISLFSSTTSIVIFLGILTSRFAEDDFLKSLPRKMIIGLATLFLSIATMMIAFVSALIIMLQGRTWIIILVGFLASIPITSFVWMHFPLFFKMLISTFGRRRCHKKVKLA